MSPARTGVRADPSPAPTTCGSGSLMQGAHFCTSKARLLSVPPWPRRSNHCTNIAASLYSQPDGGRTRVLASGHTALPSLSLTTPPSACAAAWPPPLHAIVDIVGYIAQCGGVLHRAESGGRNCDRGANPMQARARVGALRADPPP